MLFSHPINLFFDDPLFLMGIFRISAYYDQLHVLEGIGIKFF